MRRILDPGDFCGRVLSKKRLSGIILTETAYPRHAELPRHSHRNSYICFIRRGTYRESFGRKQRRCEPSMVAFHPAAEEHSESFDSAVRSFNLEFEQDWSRRIELASRVLDEPAEFRDGPVNWLASRIYREFLEWDEFSAMAVEGLCMALLAEAARSPQGKGEKRIPHWLLQARDFLEDRFPDKPSIAEIAVAVDVHPVYLSEQFRRFFHCTIGEFLRQRRVEYACRRIREGADSLADVALDAGFSDQSHFSRTFKAVTGATPAEYRSMIS